MELKIRNEKNRKLDTIEKIFKNHLETKIEKEKDIPYNLKGVIKTTRTTRRIDRMPNVFLIKYEQFNNTNKLEEDVKCELAVQFNNIPYNLKGVILHEGDSIENGKYCGIFDMKTIKQKPKEFKKIKQAYLLLFEKNEIAAPSTPSPSTIGNQPVLTPTAESMEKTITRLRLLQI